MRVGLTEMLEPEAKTGSHDLATGANCEKRSATEAAQHYEKNSCLRLLHKG